MRNPRLSILLIVLTISTLSYGQSALQSAPPISDSALVALWDASTANLADTLPGYKIQQAIIHRIALSRKATTPLPTLRGMRDLHSPDSLLRIITWAHSTPEGEWSYMGILAHQVGGSTVALFPLHDARLPVGRGLIDEQLFTEERAPTNWLGASYYALVPFTWHSQQSYLLLGVAGATELVTRRVVESLQFDKSGAPHFGIPCLMYQRKQYRRMLWSHGRRVAMTLHPIDDGRRILIDHLSPSRPEFSGMPQFYGPDFSQDVLELSPAGYWVYQFDQEVAAPKPPVSDSIPKK